MTGKDENNTSDHVSRRILAPFDQIIVATAFCTRLPLPHRHHAKLQHALWALPVPGALVGFVSGAALWAVMELDLSSWIAAILALMVSAILTGALHEDGLADVADGFWGGATPERRIEIMRDSRIGAYGVLALVLTTSLKIALIAEIADFWGAQPVWMMFIAIHAIARSGLSAAMAVMPMASQEGVAVYAGRPSVLSGLIALILGIAVAWLSLNVTPIWMPAVLAGVAVSVLALVSLIAYRKIGGITGDVLGAGEQGGEVACWMALAILIGS